MTGDNARWRVAPDTRVDLDALDPASTDGAPGDKLATKATFRELRHQLRQLQTRLWAEHAQSLLVVLQAMDAGGKDGTVKHVFRGCNPMGVRVTSFKQPSQDELDHDFLWRVHKVTPGKGEIGVFNRSHYEDVLVVRVHELVPEPVWRQRYETIRGFERGLHGEGTRIVKLFLHISREEQERRFRARLADPRKRWKYNAADANEATRWGDYRRAYADAIGETSTDDAPWYVVPADHKWYRNWAVSRILIETLTDMDPRFPEA